jgi:hypothetical protein
MLTFGVEVFMVQPERTFVGANPGHDELARLVGGATVTANVLACLTPLVTRDMWELG